LQVNPVTRTVNQVNPVAKAMKWTTLTVRSVRLYVEPKLSQGV